ncbi:MAG: hypothetical protein U1F68_04195 [Gammaproteobacteria bacterium]
MLPDLPGLKREIQSVVDRYLRARVHSKLGVFDKSPKHIVHEGNRMRTLRADGSSDDSDLKQASAEMTVKFDDIPRLTAAKWMEKLDSLADEMAKQIGQHLYGSLDASLEKAGQVVDGRGKPFDAETVFAVLEKIALDFDETGQHHELSIVMSPDLAQRAKKVFEQIESDPVLRQRHRELIDRKRSEWRDREATRKLVG